MRSKMGKLQQKKNTPKIMEKSQTFEIKIDTDEAEPPEPR